MLLLALWFWWAWGFQAHQPMIAMQPVFLYIQAEPLRQQGHTAQPAVNPPQARQAVELQVDSPPPIVAGKPIRFSATLVTTSGQPAADVVIVLFFQSEQIQRRRTDAAGQVTFSLPKDWPPGAYTLELLAHGNDVYESAIAVAKVVVEPIRSTIQVIPPLAGIRFRIADQEVTTDKRGQVTFTVQKAGRYELELLTPQEEHPTYHFEFDRWQIEAFETRREVSLPDDARIQVGFSVSYPITTSFVDADGNPIDPRRIEEVAFQSSHGAAMKLAPGQRHWLQANRIMRRSTGLETVPIQYSLQSVLIDGANVVNRGQQKFFADANPGNWQIELIFFPAKFAARDALFGWPIGAGIDLTYPNGQVIFHPFDPHGELVLTALPRGAYKVQVAKAPGMAPLTPVAISRHQDVELLVISYLDMGLFVGGGALFAVVLLLLGRPTLLQIFVIRRRPAPASPALFTLLTESSVQAEFHLVESKAAPVVDYSGCKGWDLWILQAVEEQRRRYGINHDLHEEATTATLEQACPATRQPATRGADRL